MESIKRIKLRSARRSIATRWMANTLGVIAILLIVANVSIYYFTRNYYYGSEEKYVVSEANATATASRRHKSTRTRIRRNLDGFFCGVSSSVRGLWG